MAEAPRARSGMSEGAVPTPRKFSGCWRLSSSVAAARDDERAANFRHFVGTDGANEPNELLLGDGKNVDQVHARRLLQTFVHADFNLRGCAAQGRCDRRYGYGVQRSNERRSAQD